MKPFDLEQALAGEPVRLRCSRKAFVKYKVDKDLIGGCGEYEILRGFWVEDNYWKGEVSWSVNGKYWEEDSHMDIIGMWEEPTPTVTLTLPCPILQIEVGERYYTINIHGVDGYDGEMNFAEIDEWVYEGSDDLQTKSRTEQGLMFRSQADAQEWLNALRNNRR